MNVEKNIVNVEKNIEQILLAIFLIYFFAIGGNSLSEIFGCSFKRFLKQKDSMVMKHILTFWLIYITTYILGWYSLSSFTKSIYSKSFGNSSCNGNSSSNLSIKEKRIKIISYLLDCFINSILIYVVLVLTTKSTIKYVVFACISAICLILCRLLNNTAMLHNGINEKNWYDRTDFDNHKKLRNSLIISNIITIIFFGLLIGLLISNYFYYKKQKLDHKKNWSLFKFWFGSECNI